MLYEVFWMNEDSKVICTVVTQEMISKAVIEALLDDVVDSNVISIRVAT